MTLSKLFSNWFLNSGCCRNASFTQNKNENFTLGTKFRLFCYWLYRLSFLSYITKDCHYDNPSINLSSSKLLFQTYLVMMPPNIWQWLNSWHAVNATYYASYNYYLVFCSSDWYILLFFVICLDFKLCVVTDCLFTLRVFTVSGTKGLWFPIVVQYQYK